MENVECFEIKKPKNFYIARYYKKPKSKGDIENMLRAKKFYIKTKRPLVVCANKILIKKVINLFNKRKSYGENVTKPDINFIAHKIQLPIGWIEEVLIYKKLIK